MSDQRPTRDTLSLEEATVSNMYEIAEVNRFGPNLLSASIYSPLRKPLKEGFLMNHATSARFVSP